MNEWIASPAAFLAAYPAFRALDPAAQQELAGALEPLDLHPGEILFAPGDPRDAMYFILCGLVSHTAPSAEGPDLVRVLGAGEAVGEIGLEADSPYSSIARTLDDTLVLRLNRVAFEKLVEKYPEAVAGLSLAIAPAARKTLLARVLCDLLGELDGAQRAALLAEMECLQLKRGDVLVRQGEDEDRMFVVVYGRLRLVARDCDGTETVAGEAGRGDTVGEASLLTGDLPSATVYATRDSAVGVISRSLFETLQYQYPDVVVRLSRIALRRAQRTPGHSAAEAAAARLPDAVSVAVLPVGAARGSVPLTVFSERLASALSTLGTTLHLNSARLGALLGARGITQADAPHPSEPMLSAWLQRQEQTHACVIYEADDTWTPWTERCLRMADRVLLVGPGASAPVATELDEPLAQLSDSNRTVLVLLQPDGISRPSGTAAWLDRYAAAGHDHVRLGRPDDFDRFLRHITGRGLGLVLGGGGARGFAHIGVFHALEECEVDVDMVGGTSMGAVLGGMFAIGLGHREILKLARQVASPLKLFDPTVPAVSFFASRKVTEVLQSIYGDVQIEDLWSPFFCVSSNLTHAVAMVHRRGPLWQGVRASMAIPAVFSPILVDGDLLVDGCVLDNLPIDVMQRVNFGGPIIAVNVFPDTDLLRDYDFGPSVSGWQALVAAFARRAKLNLLAPRDSAPLIFESLVRVMALNGVHQAKAQRGFADVYIRPPVEQYNILDFGAYRQIADIGYRSAIEALREWKGLQSREGAAGKQVSGGAAARDSITAPLHKTLAELEDLLARMN
ncbi:MAG: cyclic nucleotide-binding domain-containing protein [Nitrososphaerales archaeon]